VDLLHALLEDECAQVDIRNEELSALERDVVQDVPVPVWNLGGTCHLKPVSLSSGVQVPNYQAAKRLIQTTSKPSPTTIPKSASIYPP
jgi:hypothetical protein